MRDGIAALTVLCIDNEPAVLRGMQVLLERLGMHRADRARAPAKPST